MSEKAMSKVKTPEDFMKPEVLRQIRRFDLKAKFLMEGFLSGLHASPHKGFSVEFSEHRRYVAGDDIRSIDWQVWSRTNRYYVKQYEAETNRMAHLVVDLSGSMSYSGPGKSPQAKLPYPSKHEYATCLAGAMAYLMVKQQDPVGLITFDQTIREYLRPKSKPSHLLTILRVLAASKPLGQTALAQNLHRIAEMIPRRGLVVVMSDFLEDEAPLFEALSHLRYRGHDVILFQVLDYAEVHFPFSELTRFEDLEGRERGTITDPVAIKAGYLEALGAFIDNLKKECAKRRIDFVTMDTGTSFEQALWAYLTKRCH